MRYGLAFMAGVWLTLVFIGVNPHTTSPGVIALGELTWPVLAVLTVVVIRREMGRDRAPDRYPTPDGSRQQAQDSRNR